MSKNDLIQVRATRTEKKVLTAYAKKLGFDNRSDFLRAGAMKLINEYEKNNIEK